MYQGALVDDIKHHFSFFCSPQASDADTEEQNKNISFSLLNDSLSERFSIDFETAELRLLKELDYEEDGPEFDLTVIAANVGNAAQRSNATVTIKIAVFII